jgi:hypothetical protein
MSEFIKLYISDGSITLDDKGESFFLGLNPKIDPITPDMDMICAINKNGTQTVSLSSLYDVYNDDKDCIKFIAWLEPIKGTIPLYVYKNSTNVFASLKDDKPDSSYIKEYFSPIHVLQDITKFKYFRGRCIPDPNGEDIKICIQNVIANLTEKPTILTLLKDHQSTTVSYWIYILILIAVLIFLSILFRL